MPNNKLINTAAILIIIAAMLVLRDNMGLVHILLFSSGLLFFCLRLAANFLE